MSTRATAAGVILLGALLLPGCGDGSGSGDRNAGSDPTGPDTPVTSAPDPKPSGPTKNGAQKVEPQPGAADVRPHQFEKAKVLDERTVRVFFYQGVPPCSILDRVDVEYGTETVGLTLQIGRKETAENVACIEIAVYNYVDVRLDEPLAGRKIVDGAR